MNTSKNIVLVVPDGVGIKNYLYSRVFKDFDGTITLFHSFDDATLNTIKSEINIEKEVRLEPYTSSFKETFLKELICYCRLKYNAKKVTNRSILKFWKKKKHNLKNRLFYSFIPLVSTLFKKYSSIEKLEKRYYNTLTKNPLYKSTVETFRKDIPTFVFCTHQRAMEVPTIFAAARSLNIPTATVIYSWDNIPKARLALKADYYFVWSKYMKQELQLFYPEINEKQIKVTGTPQFEFYFDSENIIEKEIFYKHYGLDTQKKLICFSGDDVRTSPYDPFYLNDIATAIEKSSMVDDIQIVFRRCPVDTSGRYDWVLKKFPELIKECAPLWNYNKKVWSAVYPTKDDIKLLVSLAYYSELVINVGSTMAFDFGMFNKPCVYINYDTKKDSNWSVRTIYNYQHFRSMPSEDVVYWFSNKEEIVPIISEAIKKPNTEIDKWFKTIVDFPKDASIHISKTIRSCM